MEQCLKELQLEINETCSDELLQDTTDCLQWLNNCSFSSIKPSSTSHGELVEFLQTLVKILLFKIIIENAFQKYLFGSLSYHHCQATLGLAGDKLKNLPLLLIMSRLLSSSNLVCRGWGCMWSMAIPVFTSGLQAPQDGEPLIYNKARIW